MTSMIIDATYRALLGRAPDDPGRRYWEGRLSTDLSEQMFIEAIAASDEYLDRISTFAAVRGGRRLTNDVSQHGEHLEVLRLLAGINGLVVDVGARGLERSNSFDLMKHFGWRGLLVEANSKLIPALMNDFAGLKVEVINAAVGLADGTATFNLSVNDDTSSLIEAHAAKWGAVIERVEVPCYRLGSLLRDHAITEDFDLLSLDIEGLDVAVLNDLIENTGYRPRIIIIEASDNFSVRSLEAAGLSQAVCTHYFLAAQTASNLVLKINPSDRRSA